MKILVTGGAGFVGSHIVDQCQSRGDQVAIIDNISTGKKSNIHPDTELYTIDLTNPELLELMTQIKPDVVIHQAAQTRVQTSVEDPIFDATTNVLGTIQLLEACRLADVKKVVYASSAAVYGNPEYLPIDELHSVRPLSGYGVSKYTPEQYLHVYHELYGLRYTILRYANVYGIRQDPRGEGGVLSIFTDRVLRNQSVMIYGDGEQTRDYIYVEDVAKANVAAIDQGNGEVLNIGTGIQTSLNEVIQLFEEVSGKNIQVDYGLERAGDIKHSYFTNDKAIQVLNWKPSIPLAKGLKRTYEYYQDEYRKMDS
ncbi:NAD-dependent epimerase/dehydratase family protein [Hazenella coriacea]|uniref:UDP-glucose 4-epimerase n=1 Tax=Hazenella coriacea TaxID=1179467 RepID=A0A4R3L7W1_9BACL|nr:NAD-dependent epimerase/dehydratase family protein [Hazenella coriacea]TCS95632.1 UDP-glucose 4-epimerase [Hazenella coriacea]